MDLNLLYFSALLVFLVGWLVAHIRAWGDYVAIAGAALFVLVFALHMLGAA